jgi:hypothetical protein
MYMGDRVRVTPKDALSVRHEGASESTMPPTTISSIWMRIVSSGSQVSCLAYVVTLRSTRCRSSAPTRLSRVVMPRQGVETRALRLKCSAQRTRSFQFRCERSSFSVLRAIEPSLSCASLGLFCSPTTPASWLVGGAKSMTCR